MELYNQIKITGITGRYVTNEQVVPVLENMDKGVLSAIGQSVEKRPIYKYDIGNGGIKILMWSQMHGNESTTTKAVLDLISFLQTQDVLAQKIISEYSLCIIPILNPDGAHNYTRSNSVNVDLNRDSQDLSQPESKLLKELYTTFKPDFGFNLHDQRTIFGVEGTENPATVSFLSPSYNQSREVNDVRKKAMTLINIMNRRLQKEIPNQVGRFDDGFNLNCIGDTLQYNGIPTILFESGHFPSDYEREVTRRYIYVSLVTVLGDIADLSFEDDPVQEYLQIPQNNKSFCDIMIKNITVHSEKNKKITTFAILYKEVLKDGEVCFEPYVSAIDDPEVKRGHVEYDVEGEVLDKEVKVGQDANFIIGRFEFKNGLKIN